MSAKKTSHARDLVMRVPDDRKMEAGAPSPTQSHAAQLIDAAIDKFWEDLRRSSAHDFCDRTTALANVTTVRFLAKAGSWGAVADACLTGDGDNCWRRLRGEVFRALGRAARHDATIAAKLLNRLHDFGSKASNFAARDVLVSLAASPWLSQDHIDAVSWEAYLMLEDSVFDVLLDSGRRPTTLIIEQMNDHVKNQEWKLVFTKNATAFLSRWMPIWAAAELRDAMNESTSHAHSRTATHLGL